MDAFAVAHRAHASTAGVTEFLPSAMGFLVEKEVSSMGRALESPEKPLAALMGGAKVSDKILLLENILDKVDHLFIGGGMCGDLSQGAGPWRRGHRRLKRTGWNFARAMLDAAGQRGIKVHLPAEVVVASEFAARPAGGEAGAGRRCTRRRLHHGHCAIGGTAVRHRIAKVPAPIIWNGPMGVFEMPRFSEGTRVVAEAIAGRARSYQRGGRRVDGRNCGGAGAGGPHDPRVDRGRVPPWNSWAGWSCRESRHCRMLVNTGSHH